MTLRFQRDLYPPWRIAPEQHLDQLFVRPLTTEGPIDLMLMKGVMFVGEMSLTSEALELTPINFAGQAYSYAAHETPLGAEVIVGTANEDGGRRMSIVQFAPRPPKK